MIAMKIIYDRSLIIKLNLDANAICAFFIDLEEHYSPFFKSVRSDIPYHNNVHAADVTHAVHLLLCTPTLQEIFSPMEVM